jgi:hypothetical protein
MIDRWEQMKIPQLAACLIQTAAVPRSTVRARVQRLTPTLGMMFVLGLAYTGLAYTGLALAQSQGPQGNTPGAIQGTVKDDSESIVTGAVVSLETMAGTGLRTAITDQSGSFRFSPVEPGDYKITIATDGFTLWTAANVKVEPGNNQPFLSAVMEVASVASSVIVTLPPQELAAEQVRTEEKQRLLGVFPDFFVSYAPNAPPLTAAQKFHLGWKTITDPATFLDTGIAAGMQQWKNKYPEFGQGMEGYGKRFGAQYAEHASGIIIGDVVMQSIFHQDPRYFYKGTGSVRSRALYAIGTAFVRKGDNGHWQPDYTDVLGSVAAGEISTLFYPTSSRPGRRLVDDALLGFAGRAAHNLLHEFVLRKLTDHPPKMAVAPGQAIVREGTPVSLISVEDWSSKTAENGGPITFMLVSDINEDGVIVAPIGTKAWGKASFAGSPGSEGKGMHVGLEHVRLKVVDTDVPLRSTPLRNGSGALEFHRVENSGRIAITLYVAENVTLTPAR